MTWVIGLSVPELGFLVGDVRITQKYADGTQEWLPDLGVRKIFGIVPHLSVGFSGDIEVAFDLAKDLAVVARAPQEAKRIPAKGIVHRWQKSGRPAQIYARSGSEILTSFIIMCGERPLIRDAEGRTKRSDDLYSVNGYLTESPGFKIRAITRGDTPSIGSGTDFYADVLARVRSSDFLSSLWSFAANGPGGAETLLAHYLTEGVEQTERRDPGVSELLIGALLHGGGVSLFSNQSMIEAPPLRLAGSWEEIAAHPKVAAGGVATA